MADFKNFAKNYLAPEDPMDWIILFILAFVAIGGGGLIIIMMASGYL